MTSILSHIISLAKPIRVMLLGILIFSLINTMGTLYIPTLTADLLNKGVLVGDIDYIYSQVPNMLVAALVTILAAIISTLLSASAAARLGHALRQHLTQAIEAYTMRDFNRFGRGTLTIRLTHDVEKLQSTIGEAFTMVLPMPIMIAVGLILTFSMNATLGFIVVIVMILVVASTCIIQYLSLPYVRLVQVQLDRIADLVKEHIAGMKVIRAFNRGAFEEAREGEAFDDVAKRSISMANLYSFMLPTILIVFNVSSVVLVWAGGYQVEAGHIQVGQIVAVVEYALQILLALTMSVFVFMDLPEALIAYKRIYEVLSYPVSDVAALSKEARGSSSVSSESHQLLAHGDQAHTLLSVEGLSFRYDDAEVPALDNISFSLERGQTIALMGDIGSGKSTLVNALLGLAPIEKGDIIFAGQSIYDQTLDSLRQQIAYVPQKAFLFTGSIGDNLIHGLRAVASLSPEQLQDRMDEACRICDAYDFIHAFKDGYDHRLVQGGSNLSGGQRQRLAMARALMRRADLYIFDDSFSALDGTTEGRVRAALKEWLKNHTQAAVISIEQKVSSAKNADAIMVLEEGHLVGFGKHDDLLVSCEVYRQIVSSQEVM